MTDALDFGRHTLYILAAYGVSAVVIAALITFRLRRLRKALRKDRPDNNNE